ncbi:GGDEF domain-containing protein [Limobrevibacterium gyesilva]|uniref:Sensor domain-containing diguanylate cyclase n=1 Tax=Limobrevibacterium gyesilva TaxID=2991712 RepID=A0AA41YLL2_9PROT|nr:sensor domain-containing diguanylate cyclase [Limobrevibacterium gyesilva]
MDIADTHAEAGRLDALCRYDVLDTPPEESFDRITRLARTALQTPIALVSLVDRDRQWFKSRQGLSVPETPRDISFCAHAVQRDEPLIVRDALADPRFRDNPLVLGAPGVRFYMGVPLRTHDGHNIGTLCAIDQRPRKPSPGQVMVMQDLARLVMDELELRQLATTDSLTGAETRRSFMHHAQQALAQAQRYRRELSCIMLDVDHFKAVNDRHGHATGDLVLRVIVSACRSVLRSGDCLGRLGGEEFAILLPETPPEAALATAERLRGLIEATTIPTGPGPVMVTASFGVATMAPIDETADTLLAAADAALYEAKATGRNRVADAWGQQVPGNKRLQQ